MYQTDAIRFIRAVEAVKINKGNARLSATFLFNKYLEEALVVEQRGNYRFADQLRLEAKRLESDPNHTPVFVEYSDKDEGNLAKHKQMLEELAAGNRGKKWREHMLTENEIATADDSTVGRFTFRALFEFGRA